MSAARRRLAAGLFIILFLSLMPAVVSCSNEEPPPRVALIGLQEDDFGEERNAVAEYGKRRVEAELGVEVDFFLPEPEEDLSGLFSSGEEAEDGYELVISLGQTSSLEMIFARPENSVTAAAALDFETSQPVPGEDEVPLIRYRVEEGSYVCGYIAGWLTGRNDHPLTNPLPLVAFIGALDDPLEVYYDIGFNKGVTEADPSVGSHRYFVDGVEDLEAARAYAEDAVEKGADIIFCTPGPFNEEVLEVAEEKDILVILVGTDRTGESPSHVLTSLILRDDNAIFDAVEGYIEGSLEPGRQVWGVKQGTWSIAPFYSHDPYIKRELKEAVQREIDAASGKDYSS